MAYGYQYIPTEPVTVTEPQHKDSPIGDTHYLIHKYFGEDRCPICKVQKSPPIPHKSPIMRVINALEWEMME